MIIQTADPLGLEPADTEGRDLWGTNGAVLNSLPTRRHRSPVSAWTKDSITLVPEPHTPSPASVWEWFKSLYKYTYMCDIIWYMIYDIWYMIYGIWYMIYGIWYMIYDIWYYMVWYDIYIYMYMYIAPEKSRKMYCSIHMTSLVLFARYPPPGAPWQSLQSPVAAVDLATETSWRKVKPWALLICKHVGGSINGGIPKWMVYNEKCNLHGWFGNTSISSICGNLHVNKCYYVGHVRRTNWVSLHLSESGWQRTKLHPRLSFNSIDLRI